MMVKKELLDKRLHKKYLMRLRNFTKALVLNGILNMGLYTEKVFGLLMSLKVVVYSKIEVTKRI